MVIQNYQVILYQQIGFTSVMSLILTGIWGICGVISAVYATFCFDLLGRRKTMASQGLLK